MSIGNTIATSVPTIGATTDTLAKVIDGTFQLLKSPVATYPDIPLMAVLRPASSAVKQKNFGLTVKYNPSVIEDELNPSLGKVSVSINVNSTLGTVVTDALMKTIVNQSLSILVQSAIKDALVAGSLE